jgi:acetyltransferase EpsM
VRKQIPLYVFGASGHGKVVAEAALASQRFLLKGFLDDDPARHGSTVLGLPVAGGIEATRGLQGQVQVALGIGSNRARLDVRERLVREGHTVASVVHPSALVASGVRLGDGTYVGPQAVIHTDAQVGRACIVNSAAVVEHDGVLGDGVHVAPGAVLGGTVTLGEGVHVGINASVLPNLSVGDWSVVGAGAVVVRSIPACVVVAGVPARVLREVRE